MAQTKAVAKKPFGLSDKLGYMFGDFGNDFTFMLTSSFMMVFYTNVMGINAAIVGGLMMAARFIDAITDVTMGQIVDRSRPTAAGKFRPWIRRMCIPLAVAAFLVFQSGLRNMPYGLKVFWMFLTYILWGSVFYTSVNIPYGSMASAITANPDERAELSTWRSTGASLASLVINTVTPLLAYVTIDGVSQLDPVRITVIAGVYAVCGCICHMLCYKLTTERVEVPQNTQKLQVGKMLKSLFTNRALLGIILAAIMLLLGMLGMSGMAPYIFPTYYNNTGAQSTNSLLYGLVSMLVCAPLAARASKKFGKREVAATGSILCAVTWLICLVAKPESPWVFVAFYTISYTFLGFFNYVVWAMITDVIDDAEVKHGVREDGTIYSVYSFARKLGQALSSGMIGAFLGLIGYSDAVAAAPSQYPEVLDGMFNIACLIPAAGMILVALSLIFVYPLSKKKVDANAAYLKAKAEGKGGKKNG